MGFTLYAKTDVLVWTLPLSTYIFFSLTSAGLAFVSAIPVVLGVRRYDIIEKRTVFLEIAVLLLFSIVYERIAGRAVPEKAADLYNELARLMGIIAGVVLILFLWRSVIGGISSTSEDLRAFRHMIGSIPYHIELWLGLAIPTLMMLVPSIRQTFAGKVTASFLMLVGMFAGRLEFVLSGVIRPLGQMAEGRPEFVSYTPNLYEIFVALAGFSVMLFIGPFSPPCPPYGSLYMENDRTLMGDSTMDALRRYRNLGVDLDQQFREAPDHICAELKFMSLLVYKGLAGLRSEDPGQVKQMLAHQLSFLTDHLSQWIPPFTDRVTAHADSRFYADLARATRIFVEEDLLYLATIAAPADQCRETASSVQG